MATGRPRTPDGKENRINLSCTPEEKAAVIAIQKVRKFPFLVDVLREMSLKQAVAEFRELRELFAVDDGAVEDPVGGPAEG